VGVWVIGGIMEKGKYGNMEIMRNKWGKGWKRKGKCSVFGGSDGFY